MVDSKTETAEGVPALRLAVERPHAVQPGDVLAGKYRVERVLGVGGMGIVVAAEHLELHERVAIKFMLPEATEQAEAVERFLREARAAVKIKSEHVAKVTDVGRLESGEPYIVMEYLEGSDLHALLAKKGTLPIEDAVEYVLQACEAIAEAHTLGIVHRDLKPSNLFLTRRPDGTLSVKVLDFGISKIRPPGVTPGGDADVSMTRTRQSLGTPLYMPPEQMASARSADMRSDIWSLGVILFELVTGVLPWNGTSFQELRRKIAQDPVPSVRALRPDTPLKLETIIGRCLEKERDNRYPNIAELATDLVKLGPRQSLASAERIARLIGNAGLASPLPPLAEAAGVATDATSSVAALHRTSSRRRRLPVLIAAGVGLLVVFGIVASWLFRAPPSSSPDAGEASLPSTVVPAIPKAPAGAQAETETPTEMPSAQPSTTAAPSASSEAPAPQPGPSASGKGVLKGAPSRPSAPSTAKAAPTSAPTAGKVEPKPKNHLIDAEIK
jgi:serine/threonine-protein kinase